MEESKKREQSKIKINILRIILIILLIGTCSIIFVFSSQDSEESSGISRKVTETITKPIKSIQEKSEQEKEIILDKVENVVRKLAHFSIYTVIGILIMALFSTYKINEMNRISYSLILGVFYAISDEIHQCFTPGRGPLFSDILIDSLGVLIGIIVAILLIKIYKNIKIKE